MTNAIIPVVILIYTLSNIIRPLAGNISIIEYILVSLIITITVLIYPYKYLVLSIKKSRYIFFILSFLVALTFFGAVHGLIQGYPLTLIIGDSSKFLLPLFLFLLYWGYSVEDIRSNICNVILITVIVLIAHITLSLFFGFSLINGKFVVINYYFSIMPIVLFMLVTEGSARRRKTYFLYLILALLFFDKISSFAFLATIFLFIFLYILFRYKFVGLISIMVFASLFLILMILGLFDNESIGAGRLPGKIEYLLNSEIPILTRMEFVAGGRMNEIYSAFTPQKLHDSIIGNGMGATLTMSDQVQAFAKYHNIISHSMHSIFGEVYFRLGILGLLSITFLYLYPINILLKFKRKFSKNEAAGLISLMIVYIQLAIIGQPLAGGYYFSLLIIVYILKKNEILLNNSK